MADSATKRAYARTYRRTHAVEISLALGIAFAGLLTLLFPSTVQQSATYLALPELLRTAFNIAYTLGGLLTLYGLLRPKPYEHTFEAAGYGLLSSALGVQWASIVYVAPDTWPSSLFILILAVGCGVRGHVLGQGEL